MPKKAKTSCAYNPNPNLPIMPPIYDNVCGKCGNVWGKSQPKPCKHQIEELKREVESG